MTPGHTPHPSNATPSDHADPWYERLAWRYAIGLGVGLLSIPVMAWFGDTLSNTAMLGASVASVIAILLAGGLGPAVLAAAFAFGGTAWFLMEPGGTLLVSDSRDALKLLVGFAALSTGAVVDWRWRNERAHLRDRERALRLSEWRYRTLLDQASDAILVLGANGVVEVANARACELLRRSEWDVTGSPIATLLGDAGAAVIKGGGPTNVNHPIERSIARADSSVFEAELSPRALPDGRVQLVLRDVTARRLAERQVKDERDFLDAILATSTAGVAAIDPETRRCLFVNKRCEEITGIPREQLLAEGVMITGWTFFDLDGREIRESERVFNLVLRTGQNVSGALRVACRVGQPDLILQISAAPLRGTDGRTRVIVISAEDVTDRIGMERALKASEKRLRGITDAMPGSVYQYKLSAAGVQSFEFVSHGIVDLLGVTADELLHDFSRLWSMILPADQERLARAVLESARTLSRWSEEFQVRTPDGRTKWVRGTSVPEAPNAVGDILWNGLLLDITDEKRLESDLLQVQKMESIGRLAGGIAHDFNNILTAIRGNVDLLLEDLAEDHEHAAGLIDVRDASERASALTRQLLAFSRKQAMQTKDLELNTLVRDVEKMLRRVIGEDMVLLTQPSESLGLVRADPSQLEQVLLNLAVNARDAMPDGGLLTLETRNVQVDAALAASLRVPAGDYVSLVVRDTGHGMDAGTKERIFDPFFTTKPAGRGTGLGLAMVYGIIRQSGGAITVESEPERGATFRIYLPRVEPLAERVSATITPTSVATTTLRRDANILLVEDDAAVRTLTKRILREAGYEVREAADAYQALSIVGPECAGVDLVVTDVIMPGMGGRDLARELRTRRGDVRILYMSGYLDIDLPKLGLDETTQLLPKPFSRDVFLNRVNSILNRRRHGAAVA
ncbi:MAG: PAS domain S-box protein [Gemmatimonadota bacterium]